MIPAVVISMSGPAATRLKVSRPARREGHAASENVWASRLRVSLFRNSLVAIFEARPFATVRDGLRRGCYTFQPIPTDFLGAVWPPRRLFSRLSNSIALQACKQSARCVSEAFHFNLSAPERGLAAGVYGQHTDRSEMKCPTKALKELTR